MTYAEGYPVRLAGGRLALDLVNTADWSANGDVVHEKIAALADLEVWLKAIGFPDAGCPSSVEELHEFRRDLRTMMLGEGRLTITGPLKHATALNDGDAPAGQSLLSLAAASALSILVDPRESRRIKLCPGSNCGWLFIDETRNGRRRWCLMETCGNRAKAARHYAKARSAAK